MDELNEVVRSIRRIPFRKDNSKRYVGQWVEKDVLLGEVVDAFVVILRTRGCHWARSGGCSMCGYINDAASESVGEKELLHQFNEALEQYTGEKIVKVFTSGSFLDWGEVPGTVQQEILEQLSKKAERIIIESRPEFITEETLMHLEYIKGLEIAMGLESASDFVLTRSINKGFTFEDYKRAAKLLKGHGIPLKTYLLIKPPFLTEKEALDDAVSSAQMAAEYSQTISFNPTNVQKFTLVERLWQNGEFRPPWLWTVVEVLKRSSPLKGVRFMSSPTAGGTKRGAHNCGTCDKKILSAIDSFSLFQDTSQLEDLDCGCRQQWLDLLSVEGYGHTHGDLCNLI